MSISRPQPFFNAKAPDRFPKSEVIDDRAYKNLHWTEQLALRPLGSRYRREYPQGDYDIRIDNFDTEGAI
jgi:hypothetical protein